MLSELTASTRRLALVGLAKNTGKTEALAALLRELASAPRRPGTGEGDAQGRRVGVTSVGRDGEERDVIDSRIEKPRVRLPAGSLVATTGGMLRASGIAYELLEDARVRTPVGGVLIARLRSGGAIEIAGPSAAADVRAVSDAMLAYGAEQVLIDGAIDRRAASSPDVADGLVMSTGAVLGHDIAGVVAVTRDAVELVRLPGVEDGSPAARRLGELAVAVCAGGASVLVGERGEPIALPPRFVLAAEGAQIAQLLDENPSARALIVAGALPEEFLSRLVEALRRRRRELAVVVADPTRVFLSRRSPEFYRRQGVRLQTLSRVSLVALTVNPVAPQSHSLDSARLRAALAKAIPDVPIFDVLSAEYAGAATVVPGFA